jgi:hypothetical protein
MPSLSFIRSKEAKRALTLAKEIGLTREERMELATMVLVKFYQEFDDSFDGSWKTLEPRHFDALFDHLYGYHLVNTLMSQRTSEAD